MNCYRSRLVSLICIPFSGRSMISPIGLMSSVFSVDRMLKFRSMEDSITFNSFMANRWPEAEINLLIMNKFIISGT